MTPRVLAVAGVVSVGGALGAVARWWLGDVLPNGDGLPWTTLAINISGSAVLALLPALGAVRRRPLLPPLLGTGVLGGFTTLSAYAEQTRALADSGRAVAAAAYAVGSVLACLAAVLLVQHVTARVGLLQFEVEEGNR